MVDTAPKPMKRIRPRVSRITGTNIRSLAASARASTSAIWWPRSESALAATDAFTRAPSCPARRTLEASSRSSSMPSCSPRSSRPSHGLRLVSLARLRAWLISAKAQPPPDSAADTSAVSTPPPPAKTIVTRSR